MNTDRTKRIAAAVLLVAAAGLVGCSASIGGHVGFGQPGQEQGFGMEATVGADIQDQSNQPRYSPYRR